MSATASPTDLPIRILPVADVRLDGEGALRHAITVLGSRHSEHPGRSADAQAHDVLIGMLTDHLGIPSLPPETTGRFSAAMASLGQFAAVGEWLGTSDEFLLVADAIGKLRVVTVPGVEEDPAALAKLLRLRARAETVNAEIEQALQF